MKKVFDLLLYTIGHSNHDLDYFKKLLENQNIEYLVDIRSSPYSKYNQQFSKNNLADYLNSIGIKYKWMGDKLGGNRNNLLNSLGQRKDNEYDNDSFYRKGMIELMQIALKNKTTIMCSEENPIECHRHKIISNTLVNRKIPETLKLNNIRVLHIRASGKLISADKLPFYFQPSLFE